MKLLEVAELLEIFEKVEGFPAPVRDYGALSSAIYRQHTAAFGQEIYPTLDLKVAAIMDGIARSHPLTDGNKRLTLLAALTTYRINGRWRVVGDADSLTNLILRVSDEHMEVQELADLLGQTFIV